MKRTSEEVELKDGTRRRVYKGQRGGKYIKKDGKMISIGGGRFFTACVGPFCKDSEGQQKLCAKNGTCYGKRLELTQNPCIEYRAKKLICLGKESSDGYCSGFDELSRKCESTKCSIM
jgi:hypothetical protein